MIGTLFADRYRVKDLLGKGTYGRVWRATDTHQNLDVALKTFGRGTATIVAYSEATVLTALESEHILRVYNADTYQDVPYLATRIAPMGSTEDLLPAHVHGIRPDHAVSWVRQALVGLGSCHERGLVHRDIKPANVFLERQDRALLGDFGLAHRVDSAGQVAAEGTPLTMAPEMWATGTGSRLSDIYSTGVTLYRLLTGTWPIDEAARATFHPRVIAGDYRPIRDIAPHVSRRLTARVHRAMALDPADRYQSWREMHDDLGRRGVVSRLWEKVQAHADHDSCWQQSHQGGGSLHEVCVLPEAAAFSIETRRTTGARTRVVSHCHRDVKRNQLPVRLRGVFDSL